MIISYIARPIPYRSAFRSKIFILSQLLETLWFKIKLAKGKSKTQYQNRIKLSIIKKVSRCKLFYGVTGFNNIKL